MVPFASGIGRRSRHRRRRQSGQAIVYIVATLPIIFLSVLVVYNTAAATREKMKLQNTADATTYSAAVLTARSLNYLAYTNRAMAANEASIATIASVQTTMGMAITSVANIQEARVIAKALQAARYESRINTPVVGPLFALLAAISALQARRFQDIANRIASFVEPSAKPLQVGVDAIRILNEGISASQVAMLASTAAQLPQVIVDVVKANDPDVTVPPGETAILATKFIADLGLYLNTYHQSTNGPFSEDEYNEVLRFAHAAQATRDDWTKKRRFLPDWANWVATQLSSALQPLSAQSLGSAGLPDPGNVVGNVVGGLVDWKGGSELVSERGIAGDGGRIRWQSADAVEIGLPLGLLYGDIGGLADSARLKFGLGAGAAAAGGPSVKRSWEGRRLTLPTFAVEARTYGGLNEEANDTANMVRGSFERASSNRNGDFLPAALPALILDAHLHYGPRTSIGTGLTENWSMPRFIDVKDHPPMAANESDNWLAENGFKGANPLKWGKNTDKGPALTMVMQKGGERVRTGDVAGFGFSGAGARAGLKDAFGGNYIMAVSTAQVYFRRPQDRWGRRDFSADDPPTVGKYNFAFTGGYIEHRSLFSPYWHAHNVEPSLWARAVAMGGALVGAASEPDGGE